MAQYDFLRFKIAPKMYINFHLGVEFFSVSVGRNISRKNLLLGTLLASTPVRAHTLQSDYKSLARSVDGLIERIYQSKDIFQAYESLNVLNCLDVFIFSVI